MASPSTSSLTKCYLTSIPREILDAIALCLAALEPLGPPAALLPLMLTCSKLRDAVDPQRNKSLHGAIFLQKFDIGAPTRRLGYRPTPSQCAEQMYRNFAALGVLRGGVPSKSVVWSDELPDISLEEALEIAVVMMMEDDGKNVDQVILWGHADLFVKKFVMRRLYLYAEQNHGWPIEDDISANVLWLMWLLTCEESLLRLSPEERDTLKSLLLPFVYVPVRYPSALAPPTHFLVPPPILKTDDLLATIPTPHGPYPIYPAATSRSWVHYGTRPILSRPLASIPAKLLYFALSESSAPMPIAPHLDRTRAERNARIAAGVAEGVAPVREDIEEFNWGWTARVPLGLRSRSSAPDPLDDDPTELVRPVAPGYVHPTKLPFARWAGKAPHSDPRTDAFYLHAKSARWDQDWARMRLCGDLARPASRLPVANTTVYRPGCMNGLWQGKMQVPGMLENQALIADPLHPAYRNSALTEEALWGISVPMFVRLHELHGVEGEVVRPPSHSSSSTPTPGDSNNEDEDGRDSDEDEDAVPFGMGTAETHDGIRNAWFAGSTRPAFVRTTVPVPREREAEEDVRAGAEPDTGERVELRVDGVPGRGVYRPYRSQRRECQRLGNDAHSAASPLASSACATHIRADAGGAVRYAHDASVCGPCRARAAFRQRVKRMEERERRAARERERIFAVVGMGYGGDEDDNGDDDDGDYDDAESLLLDSWDGDDTSRPPSDIASPPCSGIREIIIDGSTDPAHAAAYHPYLYHGRVRAWDGFVAFLRTPLHLANEDMEGIGGTLFSGYLTGGENFSGTWRIASADPALPAWEGAFTMARRED